MRAQKHRAIKETHVPKHAQYPGKPGLEVIYSYIEGIHEALVECFPVNTKAKKHDSLTDHTFSVICDGHKALSDRKFEKSSLFVLFGAWAGFKWRVCWSAVWGFGSASNLRNWTTQRARSMSLSKQIKGLVALERIAEIDANADTMVW